MATDVGTFARVNARFRRLLPALITLGLLCPPVVGAVNTKDNELLPADPAAQRLAERYAPIAMLREEQDPPCETTAEQYQPTSVETVLGNPKVTLTHDVPGAGLEEVKKAPSAADIAGLPDGYYLDLEGEALGETCVYAGTSPSCSRMAGRRRSSTPTSPANRTTPASPSSTGSSGTSTSSTICTRATGRGCSSASKQTRPARR